MVCRLAAGGRRIRTFGPLSGETDLPPEAQSLRIEMPPLLTNTNDSAIIACTRSTSAGSRETLRGFDQMLHLEDLLVDGRIRCCQPIEDAPEFERAVQVRWALPFGLRKSKIRDCRRRPWRLDKPARLAEE